jgi:hypothetical protein
MERATKGDGRNGEGRKRLIVKLVEVSGNPRDACLRFLRRIGINERRSYREWTKPEQQRLVELIDTVPVEEAARVLRRPATSVRSMLHRLGLGGRQGREWFTVSALAEALHVGRSEVQRWVDRGWLACRVVHTQGVGIRIVDADGFCEFVKSYGRQIVGRRLSYEGLLFVRNYVFPPKHAELFSVRGSYKKRVPDKDLTDSSDQSRTGNDEGAFDESA